MTTIQFHPITAETAQALRTGGPDAYGNRAEYAVSDGQGNPCRCCLGDVPKGAGMLIFAHRPFSKTQPYAETGPIFLCSDDCTPWDAVGVPPILTTSPDYLVKGYTDDERICYGTGQITDAAAVSAYAEQLLTRPQIAFVDVRSARNNCYQLRITRA